MIAVIDNYDSFVFNLAQALGTLGETVRVFRNDAIDVPGLRALRPDALVFSPGPGRPEDAGITIAAIRELSSSIPTLGVCLGHQAIAAAFGGRVVRAREPRHGKPSPVEHEQAGLFEGLCSPFQAGRYHSLVAERASLPEALRVTAWTDDGVVMALRHVERPLFGVQFHPESVLTPEGNLLLGNFLRLARGGAETASSNH
ncbi:MAG TPA: aminodeoxychorismate/anthranilate synthase component II [Vicinamibacteria bacterium]|nr:aminodeoxychorismate/anthranilate synthase component II [Vicinamibacteria bacterium]HRB12284.1 aminodeoxychorismate/anthranilate synthase component II [Vicinamibacteria bacterium]